MKPKDVRGLFLGYLASRNEQWLLSRLGLKSFSAFRRYVSEVIGVNENSVKNWRDEFDGLNPDPSRPRKGWNRSPTPSRVYMKLQLDSWSLEQLAGLADSILGRSDAFSPMAVDETFAWAIKGKDTDTKEVVEAIEVGVLSFAESQEIHAIEGGRKLVTHLKVERSSGVSREAVRRHVHDFGPVCALCALDFRRKYQLAAGEHCLEAHHKVPLATRTEARRTNLEDFLVICPSCHRVVHKVRAFDDEALGRLLRRSA
jgi:hypothetical protein